MKSFTYVYHVSPESGIVKLRPTGTHKGIQAKKQLQAGIYVAPKFKDSVEWFLSFVAHKKKSNRYSHGTIYKIKIPIEVLQRSWFSDSWEKEFFIVEEDMDRLEIVSSDTYEFAELQSMSSRWKWRKYEQILPKSDPEKTAHRLRANLACRVYLARKEDFRKMMLEGCQPLVLGCEKDTNADGKMIIHGLFNKLETFFWVDHRCFHNLKERENLTKEEERKVNQINDELLEIFDLMKSSKEMPQHKWIYLRKIANIYYKK